MGYAPGATMLAQAAKILPPGEMSRLAIRFAANRQDRTASRRIASVPAFARLVEGVAWDERRKRLFVATVVDRALFYLDRGAWRQVPGLEGGSLAGLAVDPMRRLLWIASGKSEMTPVPPDAFRGLIGLDLDSLRVVHRIAVPGEGSPSDITVGRAGIVYAADPSGGAIYRLDPGARTMTVAVAAGKLHNPQGMVEACGGRRLYVSDYRFGIVTIDLKTGEVRPMVSETPTMLSGIDGLVAFGGDLIAIQNGTEPRRILRLTIDNRERVAHAAILEQASAAWGEPTLGTVRGGEFLYVANSQWESYVQGGLPAPGLIQRPTNIRAIRLAPAKGRSNSCPAVPGRRRS